MERIQTPLNPPTHHPNERRTRHSPPPRLHRRRLPRLRPPHRPTRRLRRFTRERATRKTESSSLRQRTPPRQHRRHGPRHSKPPNRQLRLPLPFPSRQHPSIPNRHLHPLHQAFHRSTHRFPLAAAPRPERKPLSSTHDIRASTN